MYQFQSRDCRFYVYSTVAGFDKSVIHLGPNDRGARISIIAQILLRTPGAPLITTGFRFNIRQLPETLPDSKFIHRFIV